SLAPRHGGERRGEGRRGARGRRCGSDRAGGIPARAAGAQRSHGEVEVMSDDARVILHGLMARYPDADPATLAILRRLAPLLVNGDPSEIAALQRLLPPATEAKAVEAGPLAAWPPDWTQKLHPDERKLLLALFDILDTEETGGGMAPPGDLHP